jgi:subtilisin family serine protease
MAISNSLLPDAEGVEHLETNPSLHSNFGPEIDICAQGAGAPSLNHTSGEMTFDGTSAATPTVAGAAALMLSLNPDLTWIELRDYLRSTAVQIDRDNIDPNGMWVDGFSWWYGYGRLDIEAAVRAVDPFPEPQESRNEPGVS